MTVRDDLFTYVTGVGAIAALISTRLYWQQLPEGVTYPAVRFLQVSREQNTAHDGPSGVQIVVIQFDIYSAIGAEAQSLGDLFRAYLNGIKLSNLSMIMQNELDGFEEEDNLFRISQDYLIHHKE